MSENNGAHLTFENRITRLEVWMKVLAVLTSLDIISNNASMARSVVASVARAFM